MVATKFGYLQQAGIQSDKLFVINQTHTDHNQLTDTSCNSVMVHVANIAQ